jgi:serine/threonine protein kinase
MYGPAADIWSLGCLVAEILAGRPPHAQVADADVATAVEQVT